jgi:hypothetical protein
VDLRVARLMVVIDVTGVIGIASIVHRATSLRVPERFSGHHQNRPVTGCSQDRVIRVCAYERVVLWWIRLRLHHSSRVVTAPVAPDIAHQNQCGVTHTAHARCTGHHRRRAYDS